MEILLGFFYGSEFITLSHTHKNIIIPLLSALNSSMKSCLSLQFNVPFTNKQTHLRYALQLTDACQISDSVWEAYGILF